MNASREEKLVKFLNLLSQSDRKLLYLVATLDKYAEVADVLLISKESVQKRMDSLRLTLATLLGIPENSAGKVMKEDLRVVVSRILDEEGNIKPPTDSELNTQEEDQNQPDTDEDETNTDFDIEQGQENNPESEIIDGQLEPELEYTSDDHDKTEARANNTKEVASVPPIRTIIPRWIFLALGGLLLLLIVSNVGWFIWSASLRQTGIPAVSQDNTPQQTTSSAFEATNTLMEAATQTLMPTLMPTLTSEPTTVAATETLTSAPTLTPESIETSTQASSEQLPPDERKILFSDNLADGIDPAWTITEPEHVFQGEDFISTDTGMTLFMPADWTNYQLIIKYGGWCAGAGCITEIGLRAKDQGNMMLLRGTRAGLIWQVFNEGVPVEIPHSRFTLPGAEAGEGIITLEAVGDVFKVQGFLQVSPPLGSDFSSGGIFLKTRGNFKLYSVEVIELP